MSASVLIVAAEASSSLYAQRLLELWRESGQKIEAFGIGSRSMEKAGFEILGRSEELAVVGLQEVIAHFPLIKQTFHRLVEEAERRKPEFALLLDYPDFNLRLAKELKKRGIRVIYYISPQVWAWRTGRVKLIRKIVDRMLVLFPFEEEFYRKNGVQADFVGHPLLDELSPELFSEKHRRERRSRFGIGDDDVVVGLMPGSRRSEIRHHLRTQLETARLLVKRNPRARPVLLVAPTLEKEDFRAALGAVDFPIQMIKEEPFEMINLADVILCASGTATLMVGLMEKPMVIMYRMNAITAFLAKRLVKSAKFFGMVNLIMDRKVVPELFQEQASPQAMADLLGEWIDDRAKREKVAGELKELKSRLGAHGATRNVARVLSEYLGAP